MKEKVRVLAGSTTKKVFIRRFEREPLTGFVNPGSYLQPGGVELLTPEGTVSLIPYDEVKAVSFVRDFEAGEHPAGMKVFNNRPKIDGLWVRLKFRDGEIMDGVLANDLLKVESQGFTVVPPDAYANNQRVFLPKTALKEVQVLGVVGSPLRQRKAKAVPKEQIGLFDNQG